MPPALPQDHPAFFDRIEIEGSLCARFEKMARAFASNLAVKSHEGPLTYAQLNEYVTTISNAIIEKLGPGSRPEPVALFLEQGGSAIAALLAILRSGHFYVPLDPNYPTARNGAILQDAGARLLLTNAANKVGARELIDDGCEILDLNDLPVTSPNNTALTDTNGHSLAYVLYTSGSTGTPKGVMQTHRNVLCDIRRQSIDLATTTQDRYGLIFSPSSSASVCHIFGALLNGAAVFTFDPRREGLKELAGWLMREEITILDINVATFRALCSAFTGEESFPHMRLLSPGSEPVYRRDVDLYRQYFPSTCLMQNALGTTETRTATQFFLDHETHLVQSLVPVGHVVDEKEIFLWDDDGNIVEPGGSGEIVIRSRYISPGYWKRDDLTAAAFLPDPDGGDRRIYRTGDLGQYDEEGRLVHLGRKDFQVKILGFRLETSEVEMALVKLPGVAEAVVTATADEAGNNRLVAYLVMHKRHAPSLGEFRQVLATQLPDYAVPSHYEFLEAMPLTLNGKLSRKDLPPPNWQRRQAEMDFIAPQNEQEILVAQLMQEVLGLDSVGALDDFFAIGGHSLLALRLMMRIEEECGRALPMAAILTSPTPRALATLLESNKTQSVRISPVAVYVPEGEPVSPEFGALFCVPGSAGSALQYLHLARYLAPECILFGFEPYGLHGREKPHSSVEEMAAQYIHEMKTMQSQGPYMLCGFSLGGLVAYEMARELRENGEEVVFLGLFDTDHPGCRPQYRDGNRRISPATLRRRWTRKARRFVAPRLRRAQFNLHWRLGLWGSGDIRQKYMEWAHPAASRSYKPKPYGGPLVYFRAINPQDRIPQTLPDGGWGAVVQETRCHDIHGNHCLVNEPYVGEVAAHIRTYLRNINAQVSPTK